MTGLAAPPRRRVALIGMTPICAHGVAVLLWEELEAVLTDSLAAADVIVHQLDPHFVDLQVRRTAQEGGGRIVAMAPSHDAGLAREALSAGATACVTCDSSPQVVLEAVTATLAGERFICPQLAVAMLPGDEGPLALTERETSVLRLTALGYQTSEIAEQMYLSARTIEGHRATLQQKLGTSARWELVAAAIERGMLCASTTANL